MAVDEEELRERVVEHLQARPGNPEVGLFWNGFILGMGEAGVISLEATTRLLDLLPPRNNIVVVEAMLGIDYVDKHPELKEEAEAHGRAA